MRCGKTIKEGEESMMRKNRKHRFLTSVYSKKQNYWRMKKKVSKTETHQEKKKKKKSRYESLELERSVVFLKRPEWLEQCVRSTEELRVLTRFISPHENCVVFTLKTF